MEGSCCSLQAMQTKWMRWWWSWSQWCLHQPPVPKKKHDGLTLPETKIIENQWLMVGVLKFPFGMLEFSNLVNREWREDSSAWQIVLCWWCGWELPNCVQTKTMIPIRSVICILPRHISDWFSVACPCSLRTSSLLKHHPGGGTNGAGATTRGNPGEIWASILAARNSWKWGWFWGNYWFMDVGGWWHFGKDAWGKTARHTSQRCLKPVRLRCVLCFFVLILMIYMLLTSSVQEMSTFK